MAMNIDRLRRQYASLERAREEEVTTRHMAAVRASITKMLDDDELEELDALVPVSDCDATARLEAAALAGWVSGLLHTETVQARMAEALAELTGMFADETDETDEDDETEDIEEYVVAGYL